MLMAIQRDTKAEHNKLFVSGVAFAVAIALLIWLCVAIYQKQFQTVTWVDVKADQAGLQLPRFGDVRMHGVIVGQIRKISQDGKQADIRLGLDPEQAKAIPANVTVQIRPTTLFGQKYVQFVDPKGAPTGSLTDGAVIPADRVQTTVELETILAHLFPLLEAVRPQDLNSTLSALATALSGNGERLGTTMVKLDAYLKTMNVHLPTLKRDLQDMASVAHTYSMTAPDLVATLKNATTTARTVSSQRQNLQSLLTSVTGVSDSSEQMLAENEAGIRTEGKLAVPFLKLLDTYSPEYPCLLKGLDKYTDLLNKVFVHTRVNQTMIFGATQRPAYTQKDRPEWGEVGHGPWCEGLPNPPVPMPAQNLKNGIDYPSWSQDEQP